MHPLHTFDQRFHTAAVEAGGLIGQVEILSGSHEQFVSTVRELPKREIINLAGVLTIDYGSLML